MPNLRILYISETNTADLELVAALSKLEALFLLNLPRVNDLRPLKRLANLRCIVLKDLPEVKDLSPLVDMPNLKTISTDKDLPPQLSQKRGECENPQRLY